MKNILALCVLTVSCFSLVGCHHSKKQTGAPVKTFIAEEHTYPLAVNAYGSIVSDDSAQISTEVSGTIEGTYFKNGQYVKKGQMLFKLDDQKDKANLASIAAQLELKQSMLSKERKLFEHHYISQAEWENIKSQVKDLSAQADSLQTEVNKKKIVAPFSGFLGERKINLGDYVNPGTLLVSLVNKNSLKVKYNLPDKFSNQIKDGQAVVVSIPELNRKKYFGKVGFISADVDPNSRSLSLEAVLYNTDSLKPGFFVEIKQVIDPSRKVILLPEQAVQIGLNGKFVYRVVNNKAIYTPVKTSIEEKGVVVVYSGVKPGDEIIISGSQNVNNNAAVHVVNNTMKTKAG